jgi:guanine deaminase
MNHLIHNNNMDHHHILHEIVDKDVNNYTKQSTQNQQQQIHNNNPASSPSTPNNVPGYYKNQDQLMRIAIEKTREGIHQGQSPFGAVIATTRDGELITVEHNTVWKDCDPTCHAEINAIRAAARKLNTIDLTGHVCITTCEPCPQCLSAIHWSKLDAVVYGATIQDASQRGGFSELFVPAKQLAELGGSPIRVERITNSSIVNECVELFDDWKNSGKAKVY